MIKSNEKLTEDRKGYRRHQETITLDNGKIVVPPFSFPEVDIILRQHKLPNHIIIIVSSYNGDTLQIVHGSKTWPTVIQFCDKEKKVVVIGVEIPKADVLFETTNTTEIIHIREEHGEKYAHCTNQTLGVEIWLQFFGDKTNNAKNINEIRAD